VRRLAFAAALVAGSAHAVSPDLKVSTDDLNEAGESFIEVQANKATGWPFQFLGEYSYGITDFWQVAAKVPFAREDGVRSLGANVEVRYLGEHDREKGGYWGVNLTAGRGRERAGDPSSSGVEIAPVLGWRGGNWHFAANTAIGFPTSGDDRRATFVTALKAGYGVGGRSELGVEYFLDAGPFSSWHPRHERTEFLFLAWDKVVGNELNIALGRGLTDASERWVLKVIYSFPIFAK
jgi:hypothetical protein